MRNLLYIAAILIVGCSKPTMEDAFIAPPVDVTTPTETTTTTTDNGNNTNTATNTSESTVDASQYMVIAEGEGSIEVINEETINGNLSVTVRVTPDAGYTILDFQGADLTENIYELEFNVTGAQTITVNFKDGDTTPARAYLTQDAIWISTEGHNNSLEWYEYDQSGDATWALNRAYEAGSEYIDNVISTAYILWFPYSQSLANGDTHERVANTAGGTACGHDDDAHSIAMRHGSDASIILHEAGHTVHNACNLTDEQVARWNELYVLYRDEAIDNGLDISQHYQLGFGAGEFFACSTSAYFASTDDADLRNGSGSIPDGYRVPREALQAKYPLMFNLMQEIYN